MTRARVLYADPGWLYRDNLPGPKRGASSHYRCMTTAEICLYELPPIADDAWLFLWRVATHRLDALAVMRAWGFELTGGEVVWVKVTNDGERIRLGMGRTVRNAHEVCLIGKRGKPERKSKSIASVLFAPRGEHSAKPEAMYRLIEDYAAGPYCELFARRRRPGWMQRGDQLAEATQ